MEHEHGPEFIEAYQHLQVTNVKSSRIKVYSPEFPNLHNSYIHPGAMIEVSFPMCIDKEVFFSEVTLPSGPGIYIGFIDKEL